MNILFTLAFADGYHGSVRHIKELASYYVQKGHYCNVVTLFYTPEILESFKTSNINLIRISEVDYNIEYDIVFGIHHPVLSCLLNNHLKLKKLVINSLSKMELLERFPNYYKSASMLLVCSHEIRSEFEKKYNLGMKKIDVLENLIPDTYFDYNRKNISSGNIPEKIAIVSNHIPEEIIQLKDIESTIKFTYFGVQTGNYVEITPEILGEFDVIISIGKTIQYALGMGIPAYEYDRFGGNGYITLENMDCEANYNFAGRNTYRKLSAEEILQEIKNEYEGCLKQQIDLKEKAANRFLLSKRLDELLENINACENFSYLALETNVYDENVELETGLLFSDYVSRYRQNVYDLTNSINALQVQSDFYKNQLDGIVNSKAWKMVLFIRKIISVFKR